MPRPSVLCRCLAGWVLILTVLGVQPAAAESPAPAARTAASHGVAFVVDLKGDQQLAGKRAQLMSELQAGQAVTVAAEGQMVIMFIKSGHEFSLAPGEYLILADLVQVAKGGRGKVVRRTTSWRPSPGTLVNVTRTATASVRMRGLGSQAPDPNRLRILSPSATVVTSLTPTLSWQVAPGTRVTVRLEQAGKIIRETTTEALSWKLPGKLEAGQTYRWSVAAGKEDSSAEFSVLDTAGQKQLASLPPAQGFSDRLMRAITLQTLGAEGEARLLYAELAAERPDLPELANLAR